jgi:hypothetical protein
MNASSQIEFSVHYRLGEYLEFVTEHSFDTEEALRNTRGLKRRLIQIAQRAIATIGFFYKMSRVGRCDFIVDSSGVTRHSKNGAGSVPWPKVKAVHIYSPGYLIELQSGAMPIPFRVLDLDQRELFCAFASGAMVNGAQPNNSFKPNPLRGSA